jgi:hypothetical protein
MMLAKPNYDNLTVSDYQSLLELEAYLVQFEELFESKGMYEEARWIRHIKKFVSIRRKCMKAALRQKTKTASAPTLAV